ncbi:class I SAM-dependent RNA methyltransferase [archaeon]|nr:class I SAM-dependent RNA methyltransferase [archaeon]
MAEPLCPYFGTCGGCSFQHVDYEKQLEIKKEKLTKAIDFSEIQIFSNNSYNYRNRMDFVFGPQGLSLRKKQKWYEFVNVENCVISEEKLNILLKEVRNHFKNVEYFDPKKQTGLFRYAVIRTPKNDSSISFVLNEDSSRLTEAVDKIKEYAKISSANNILVTYVHSKTDESVSSNFFVVKGKEMLETDLGGKPFLFHVQGFFQNNTVMAEKMQEYCNQILKKYNTTNAHLLDLYGGVGTFGIINASLFKTAVIVENSEQSISCAKLNIEKNNLTKTTAIVLEDKQLKKLDLKTPLFMIADPPRSGMHPKTIEHINSIKPEVMIYISCNIEQLGKDLKKFKHHTIKSAAMFDLFPHTPHIEGIVELVKA